MKSTLSASHPSLSTLQQPGSGAPVQPKFFASVGDPALKRSFKGHKDTITALAFNPNLKQAVSSSLDGTLMVWNFKPTLRPYRFIGHSGPIYDMAVSPNGQVIASASADETVRIWTNTVEGHSKVIKSHSAPVKSVAFSSDGSLLLSGSDDKTLKVFQVNDRKFQFSINAHANWIRSCQFSPDTRLIVSGSDDRTVKLWDVTQKSMIMSFDDHESIINSVKFHPDGTCIASGSADKSIKIWDIRSKRLLQHYDAHQDSVNQVAFHPNGRYLLSASNDSTIKIWDMRQGHILYTLYGHEGASHAVNFSPCGDYFCSAGIDSVVMVWKSNLSEQDQELIEDIGNLASGGNNMQAPGLTGGITSNRKAKAGPVQGQQISAQPVGGKQAPRYQQLGKSPQVQLQKPTQAYNPTQGSYDNTSRSKAIIIPPEADANRYEQQQHGGSLGQNEELAQNLQKIVSQLEIISSSLLLLDQRISTNEEQVAQVLDYFKEVKEQNAHQMLSNSGVQHSSHHGFPHSFAQNQINQHHQYRAEFDNIRQTAGQVEQQVVRVVNEQLAGAHTGFHNPNAHVHFPQKEREVRDQMSSEEEEDVNNSARKNDREDFDEEEEGNDNNHEDGGHEDDDLKRV